MEREDQGELDILSRKPVCFLIVGKPGTGKTTLARNLSSIWKCHHVDGLTTIDEAIQRKTALGEEAEQVLRSGKEISGSKLIQLITEKLHSPGVAHYGYILDCFPVTEEMSIEEQLAYIRSLELNPDVIINLKVPDQDLEVRRTEQRVDPISNKVLVYSVYNPESKNVHSEEQNDDEQVDDSQDTPETDEKDFFTEDLVKLDNADEQLVTEALTKRLVQRSMDLKSSVCQHLQDYRENVLTKIEDFIISHNQQFVIELDANLPPKQLFQSLLIRLHSMGLSRCPSPLHLVDPNEGEEETEGIDNNQFLQQLSEMNNILSKFRWRRSKWGRYCPVELSQGNLVPGKMEFAVGFMDKMYSLSSEEALNDFVSAPRDFLLPPNPKIPCKVCIVGPPLSGKSTLVKSIADKYDAMVIVMSDFLEPLLVRAREAAVEEAKVEAENSAINTISKQLAAQQAHQGGQMPEVTAENPDVVMAVRVAIEKAQNTPREYTQDMYMEALREGIVKAEEKLRHHNPSGPRFGGWVVDGFPATRENWESMIESNLLPDFVLSIEDEQAPQDFLLARYAKIKGLPDPSTIKALAKPSEEQPTPVSLPPELAQWQQQRKEYDKLWGQLSASMKGSAIDPLSINCSLSIEEMMSSAITQIEDVFVFKSVEYSAMEEDADADDDPILGQGGEGDEEVEESEEEMLKKKPWGDTRHFCPVALAEKGVLWPGSQDYALRYREKLYFFSTEEAKDLFAADPMKFLAQSGTIATPPLRLLLLGPIASGKTTVGRCAAKHLGIFHVSFQEYLQEEILSKMKKPPLIDDDDWELAGELAEEKQEDEDEDDLDYDVRVKLSQEESEIRSHLIHREPLSEEIIEKLTTQFWEKEPYKSTGFILEGFPTNPDDLRFLASKGLFTDCAVVLQVEEKEMVNRLLPNKMGIWYRKKQKRLQKKAEENAKKIEEWEADKALRKADLKAEYEKNVATRKAEKSDEDEDDEDEEAIDEDLTEYEEGVAEIDQEEFPDDEEEEEEEEEEDARHRLKTNIIEKYDEQTESILNIQDVLTELQIPCHMINAGRRIPVVQYSFSKAICPYTAERQGLLSKCTSIDGNMAKKLLDQGYKQLSKFKMWCPVKLFDSPDAVLPPNQHMTSQMFPVIHHSAIYFLSSAEARDVFITNPEKFLAQPIPKSSVPVRLAIIGPPKCGKSTVARRFAAEYGCVRLSIGEALRMYIDMFPRSKLTELIESHLRSGQVVPDDLCVHALEKALLSVQCTTRGYILDGWPLTMDHVDLLTKFRIIPVSVVELDITDEEMLRRANIDQSSQDRELPLHDSPGILSIRSSHYRKSVVALKRWYSEEHDNYEVVDGSQSVWRVWDMVKGHALRSAQQIQHYLHQVTNGKAASINGLCITPKDFTEKLGEFAEYCPVSLALRSELVDCSKQRSLTFAVEYNGKYYKMSSEADLKEFQLKPDYFVLPQAPRALPPSHELPRRKSHADVKAMFPKQVEIQGYCPVTYVDGNRRYESLCPGNPDIVAEYKGKLYCFRSIASQENFMRQPERYEVASLPSKLPPLKQPLPVTSLPMLGYLEQTVATSIINSLSAVGAQKPKFPFMTSSKSALFYVACHLKAFNPKSSVYVRNKFKKKLARFEEQCSIILYLSSRMKQGYKEPVSRSIDFDFKMNTFLKLKTRETSLQTV
ncbi:adenylate kinase 9-like [Halichondria panicea]|uniref:adenylate kinase 9-like n=1 Tax=Halichondria panicea TaxID=6063 RepID=UPI00312B33DF